MANVNNYGMVNRASEVIAGTVQNQSAGKVNDVNNVGQTQRAVVSSAEGASGHIAAAHRANDGISVGDALVIDKAPPKPNRDVPARTALARIANAVNPIVAAYDKLAINNIVAAYATYSDTFKKTNSIGLR